jgi:hypothetical protein
MRALFFWPALLLTLFPVAARAEVLAVCGAAAAYSNAAISTALVEPVSAVVTPLALSRDATGFDILLNWGERNQHSLRADGGEILGSELGNELIHLIVIRPGAQGLEHFVFSLEDDAPGELIWNGASETPGRPNEPRSYEMPCFKP